MLNNVMVKTMRKQFSLSTLRSKTVNVIPEVKFKLRLIGDWFCSNLVTMSFLELIPIGIKNEESCS